MAFERFPCVVGWELTLACNLRCRHCASSAGQARRNELSLEEAYALCDQFPALAVQEVDFTGGEALLRPDWWRIAAYLAEIGDITTRIVTNGHPLTPRVVSRIREVGISSLGVSLDGLEDTHDEIRGYPGLWRRVLDGIERARAAGIEVAVLTAVNPKNLRELPALLPILLSAGVCQWQLQPNLPQGRGENADLRLSDQEFLELGAFFREQEPRVKRQGLRIVPADSLGYFTELDLPYPPWRGCQAGIFEVAVTSDGKVKGCLTMSDDMVEGDLRQADLWDIWFGDSAFAYNRQFSVDEMGPLCRGCAMAEQCRGGCTSMSTACTGRPHNNPYCFLGIRRRRQEAEGEIPDAGARAPIGLRESADVSGETPRWQYPCRW